MLFTIILLVVVGDGAEEAGVGHGYTAFPIITPIRKDSRQYRLTC